MPYRHSSDPRCPGCRENVAEDATRCASCSYGIRPAEFVKRVPPKQLFAKSPQETESIDRLECGFRCPYCSSFGADVREIAAKATGLPPLFDIDFFAARCLYCGAVTLFDMEHLKRCPGIVWDLIAER